MAFPVLHRGLSYRRPSLLLVGFALALSCLALAVACGGGGGGAQGDGPLPGPSCSAGEPTHTGQATYYEATGDGACMLGPSPNDLMVGAMNKVDYGDSGACGACVRLQGPKAEITVRIVDLCPECKKGAIDLSRQAFGLIADISDGIVPITWRYVPCNVTGPIRYHFKDGSSQWWAAVQIRNSVNRIAKLEYLSGDAYHELARVEYNHFVAANGMGPGPFTFRTTDVYGQVIVDTGIVLVNDGDVSGAAQFPACPGT